MLNTHKEMTKHIRGRLSAHKVPCRVKMNEYCGVKVVTIMTPSYDYRWTAEEAKSIAICVQVNGLTGSRKTIIDLDNLTIVLQGTTQQNFEFHPI